jgi:DNA-binding transcriptional regulator GbsR (MarR family)
MTQKQEILNLLSEDFLTISDIFKLTGFPKPSIRRVLHQLRKENIISKPIKKGIEKGKLKLEANEYWRKMISSLHYCSGDTTVFTALTYELSKQPKRLDELQSVIEKESSESCSEGINKLNLSEATKKRLSNENLGYSRMLVDEFDLNYIFPSIQVESYVI